MYSYDDNNVFAQIIRKELNCDLIYEDDHNLSFFDKYPSAPKHALVIPKGKYVSYDHFMESASDIEILSIFRVVQIVTKKLDLVDTGYRLVTNHGENASQMVMHFHIHIMGGSKLAHLG